MSSFLASQESSCSQSVPYFFPTEKRGAHPTTADVVVHGDKLAVLQTGLKFVIGRRARETGGERRLAGLDQLDGPADFLGAVRRRQDFVIVLLAAEAAAKHDFRARRS